MLTIFKEKIGELRNPEVFFDWNIKTFDMQSEENRLVVRVLENGEITESGVFISPFGKGKLTDIKTSTKLALCLVNYPGFLFDSRNVSTRDMTKVLVLPRGSIYIELTEPYQYLFKVNARTSSGVLMSSSTDINVWYFSGRN